jgi:nicotinamide riboside kinase
MLSLRMWARIKYGIKISLVDQALKEDVTSLYILTRPVLEWEVDPLREAPALLDRVWIYNHYLKELSSVR